MKKITLFVLMVATALFVAGSASAQAWRGMGRLQGVVVDQNGKAVAGAKVMLRSPKSGGSGPDVTTDGKGKWAALGLMGDNWNIDIEAQGFETKKISVPVSEVERNPNVKTALNAVVVQQAPQQAHEEIVIGGKKVDPAIAKAVEDGNTFLTNKQYKEAAAEYEKAAAVLTDNIALKQALARAYYGAGEMKKAVAVQRDVVAADPANGANSMLLVNLLLEDGDLTEAKSILDKMPDGSVTDPTAMINVAILFMNKNKPADAMSYLEKAIKIDDKNPSSYYYHGLAAIQQQKLSAAKTDFQKVIELAPDSPEAKDAKDYLEQIEKATPKKK